MSAGLAYHLVTAIFYSLLGTVERSHRLRPENALLGNGGTTPIWPPPEIPQQSSRP